MGQFKHVRGGTPRRISRGGGLCVGWQAGYQHLAYPGGRPVAILPFTLPTNSLRVPPTILAGRVAPLRPIPDNAAEGRNRRTTCLLLHHATPPSGLHHTTTRTPKNRCNYMRRFSACLRGAAISCMCRSRPPTRANACCLRASVTSTDALKRLGPRANQRPFVSQDSPGRRRDRFRMLHAGPTL